VTLPFTLEDVTLFLVDTYDGFDRPNTLQLVSLLGDGTRTGNDQVLQEGSSPFRQATLTGTIVSSADIALLRGYYDSREELTFVDGDGEEHGVRILELTARAFTGWWSFAMQLIETTRVIEGS
jgi:hypothetical protein